MGWVMAVSRGQTLAGIIMTKERFYENVAVRTTQEPTSRVYREKNQFNDLGKRKTYYRRWSKTGTTSRRKCLSFLR